MNLAKSFGSTIIKVMVIVIILERRNNKNTAKATTNDLLGTVLQVLHTFFPTPFPFLHLC